MDTDKQNIRKVIKQAIENIELEEMRLFARLGTLKLDKIELKRELKFN
jgi:hypothetical protein